jgi:[ribosomal protein S5]-alanine N-acetyltransferase
MNHQLHIKTQRLELLPCSLEVAQAAANLDKSLVQQLLGVQVPDDWYQADVKDILPNYIQILKDQPSQLGWGIWLIIHQEKSTLIGDLGFSGNLTFEKTVEIGYGILPPYRQQGYATEATQALVDFAFSQLRVKKIIAHCPVNHIASIRILQKLGMQQLGIVELTEFPSTTMLEWQLTLESRSNGY